MHIGYNPKTKQFEGLPAEWRALLDNSNISREDQEQDPDTVLEVLEFHQKLQAGKLLEQGITTTSRPMSPTPQRATSPEIQRQLSPTSLSRSSAPGAPIPKKRCVRVYLILLYYDCILCQHHRLTLCSCSLPPVPQKKPAASEDGRSSDSGTPARVPHPPRGPPPSSPLANSYTAVSPDGAPAPPPRTDLRGAFYYSSSNFPPLTSSRRRRSSGSSAS